LAAVPQFKRHVEEALGKRIGVSVEVNEVD
jgi:hypothetical protein